MQLGNDDNMHDLFIGAFGGALFLIAHKTDK